MKLARFSIAALLMLTSLASAQVKKLVRVYLNSPTQAQTLLSYPLDFASHRIQRYADIVVTAPEERMLQENAFQFEILESDLDRAFAARFAGKPDLGDYHTYQEMVDEMTQIATAHPGITMLTSIGKSLEGRDIWAMKVSDNPTSEESDEPEVLYMANMHARELITPEIILHFLNHLVDNYGSDSLVTALVDYRELWLIPTQNPDGHVYVENADPWWRKNRRNNGNGSYGVDLNRNYSFNWGYDNTGSSPVPSSETYRGTGPFSEPESQAIRQLCTTHNFVLALSYHSYGRLWLFPWGYVPQNTPDHEIFVELASNCVAANGYLAGNPASGAIYLTNGDTDDYFYGEQTEKNRIFSFSPEVGDSFWPAEELIPQLVAENLPANLYIAQIAPLIVDNPRRIFSPAIPTLAPLGTTTGNYVVSWTISNDPDNPAVAYQLDELSGYAEIIDDVEMGGSNWQLGNFTVSSARSHSGAKSLYSGQGDNLNHHITAAFPRQVESGDQLEFWAWYSIELNWDYAYVEVSVDGGTTFQSIPGNLTTNANPNGTNLGNGITGNSNGWQLGLFSLNSFAGQSITIRFRYVTDQAVTQEGIYLDDVNSVAAFDTSITLSSNIASTSYPITGRSDGIYYYRVRARDVDQQWGGWSDLEAATVSGGLLSISGNAWYCQQAGGGNADKPVAGLTAALSQNNVALDSTQTGAQGDYVLAAISPGASYQLDVRRAQGGVGDAITPGDALLAFKAYLQSLSLSGSQKLAADANGDLEITPGDALLIFHRYLGMIAEFPVDDWRAFPADYDIDAAPNAWTSAPLNIDYANVTSALVDQDFLAVAKGDVDLSWLPAGFSSKPIVAKNTSAGDPLHFSVSASSLLTPSATSVALRIELEGNALTQGVYALGGELQYDAALLDITAVRWGEIVPKEGFLADAHLLPAVAETRDSMTKGGNGRLRFGGYSTSDAAIRTAGTLLEIEAKLHGKMQYHTSISYALTEVSAMAPKRLAWNDFPSSAEDASPFAFENIAVTAEGAPLMIAAIPAEFALEPNFPNPFNPTTQLRLQLPESALVSLRVFNSLGQLVRTLAAGQEMRAGFHTIEWNGRNDAGAPVGSAIYFVIMQATSPTTAFSQTRKITLIK